MTTQVIFTIDKALKERAMKKARGEGMPLASFLKLVTRAYVEGKIDIGIVGREEHNQKTTRLLKLAHEDIQKGKNLSPEFKTSKEAIAYLKKI